MIQRMTDLENEAKTTLNESQEMPECSPAVSDAPVANPGNPVTMNISLNASGKDNVADLMSMMKNAGLSNAEPVTTKTLSPRMDIERLRGIVDGPEMHSEEYVNSPDEDYQDHKFMTKDLSGGINREKNAYSAAQPGDNAMAVEGWKPDTQGEFYDDEEGLTIAWEIDDDGDIDVAAYDDQDNEVDLDDDQKAMYVSRIEDEIQGSVDDYGDYQYQKRKDNELESIRDHLYNSLSEKKAKPDYIDIDGDGDTKEPMKKAVQDKHSKKKNDVTEADSEKVQKNLMYMELDAINSGKGKQYFMMDYEMPFGIHSMEAFKKQINDNPVVQKLRKQGYVGPKQIAGWTGDIDTEIRRYQEILSSGNTLDSVAQDAKQKLKFSGNLSSKLKNRRSRRMKLRHKY